MAQATGAIKLLDAAAVNTTALGTTGDWELPTGAEAAVFYVAVTASSGFTSGFTVRLQGKDEVTGSYWQINATPTAITANGNYIYVIYPAAGTTPGAGSDITAVTNTCFIPPKGRVVCSRTDGTYTLKISMTPLM